MMKVFLKYLLALAMFPVVLSAQPNVNKTADSILIATIFDNVNLALDRNTDSARILANQVVKLARQKGYKRELGDAYFFIAISFGIDHAFDSATFYYKKSLGLFREANALKACAVVLSNLGELYFKNGRHHEANHAYFESLAYFQKIGFKEGIARSYFNIGIVFKLQGNYPLSSDYFFKALAISEQTRDTVKIVVTLQEIGNLYLRQQQYGQSAQYYQKALGFLKTGKPSFNLTANLICNLGIVEKEKGNPDMAARYYDEALALYKKAGNRTGMANALLNLGELHNQLKEYSQALAYNEQSLSFARQLNDPYTIAFAIFNRGSIYRALKDYPKSLQLLRDAMAKSRALNDRDLEKSISEEMSQAYASVGDYKSAYRYHCKFKEIQDSLRNDETTRRITMLEMQYDFDKKQRKLEFAQKQRNLMIENKLKRQQMMVKASVIFSSLLALLLLTSFGYYRSRQVAKVRKMEMELNKNLQQSLSQQMNPHFIFNCLNSIRALIIDNRADEADRYFGVFANLMRNNLEFSQYTAIPVIDEIKALELYVALEKLRFKNKFGFRVDIDPDIDVYTYKIPSLLLQPFVENSILHGVRDKEDGMITVSIALKNKALLCVVDDNGLGRKPKNDELIERKHRSYGTHLTRKRLELICQLHGDALPLTMTDKKGPGNCPLGTRVEFGVPIIV